MPVRQAPVCTHTVHSAAAPRHPRHPLFCKQERRRGSGRCGGSQSRGPWVCNPCPVLQVAIIAGNFELAEYIKNHKETDIST